MKWLIASDLHGSVSSCQRLMEAYRRENAQRLLLLGDILDGGSASRSRAVAALLNGLGDSFLSVLGNCDPHSDLSLLDRPPEDMVLALPTGKKPFMFATHGHIYNNAHRPPHIQPGDVLLHGHTHVPMTERHSDILCFNPGSVAEPRWGSAAGYMTLEDGVFLWKTLEGAEYRRYELD